MESHEGNPQSEKSPLKEWTESARVLYDRLKKEAKEKGYDERRLLRGFVLETIINDDTNCFLWDKWPLPEDIAQKARTDNKEALLSRIAFEVEAPETPREIRERLQRYREKVNGMDWSDKAQYEDGKQTWYEQVYNFTRERIRVDPKLKQAVDYRARQHTGKI